MLAADLQYRFMNIANDDGVDTLDPDMLEDADDGVLANDDIDEEEEFDDDGDDLGDIDEEDDEE